MSSLPFFKKIIRRNGGSTLLRNIVIMGFLSSLFGCGDGRPGLFSSNGYHIGDDQVWYKTSTGIYYEAIVVVGADPGSFQEKEFKSNLFSGASANYGMDKHSVFWAGAKIEGADLASFEYVCDNYSKDKNAVYYRANRLTDDVAHFAVVSRQFVKDSKFVYFGNTVLSEDPAHFARVGDETSDYYADGKKCWYDIYELKYADPATFHYFGPKTAADGKRIFYEMNEVEGADLKSYQIMEDDYSKDAKQVYQKGQMMPGANPATFRLLGHNYSVDNKYCFYYTIPLQDADPATFQLIDDFYTKDARLVFCNGNLIEGADPATFRILNSEAGCSCDAHHAYNLEKRIEGVNPNTFPPGAKCKTCNESGVTF